MPTAVTLLRYHQDPTAISNRDGSFVFMDEVKNRSQVARQIDIGLTPSTAVTDLDLIDQLVNDRHAAKRVESSFKGA